MSGLGSIDCDQLVNGGCRVAAKIGVTDFVAAHPSNCVGCLGCEKPKSDNKFVRGLLTAKFGGGFSSVKPRRSGTGRIKYTLPTERVPTPTSDRLVIQIGTGEQCGKELKVSGPRAKKYADRCGADYLSVTHGHFRRWPMASKWRASTYARHYQQTVFLDTDVLIADDAPNLFDQSQGWGGFDEMPSFVEQNNRDALNPDARKICDQQGVNAIHLTRSFNGGILLIPGESCHLYSPPAEPFEPIWILDQVWLTLSLLRERMPITWFSPDWYSAFIDSDFWSTWDKRPFVHMNGCQHKCTRLDLMKLWDRGIYRKQEPPGGYWRPRRK